MVFTERVTIDPRAWATAVPGAAPNTGPIRAAPGTVPGAEAATPADAAGPYPEVDRLVSGEAVELDVRVARIGSRVLALLLDIMVQIGLLVVLGPLTVIVIASAAPGAVDGALLGVVQIGLVVLVLVGYPVVLESAAGGRTLGKLALGLRVVRDDGGPIRFRHALTRSLVSVAVEWPGLVMPLLTWVVSLATMMANPRSKRLGDLAAGTIVIHERTPASWGWVPAMPPALARWAALLDLTGLDDDLALAVRHFLARNREIAEPARRRLGHSLAVEVAAGTTPPPPPGVPGWAYLAAVLAERHRRAAHRLAIARSASMALWPGLGLGRTQHPGVAAQHPTPTQPPGPAQHPAEQTPQAGGAPWIRPPVPR